MERGGRGLGGLWKGSWGALGSDRAQSPSQDPPGPELEQEEEGREVDGGEAMSPVLTPAYLPGPPGPRLAPTPAPPLPPAAGCD